MFAGGASRDTRHRPHRIGRSPEHETIEITTLKRRLAKKRASNSGPRQLLDLVAAPACGSILLSPSTMADRRRRAPAPANDRRSRGRRSRPQARPVARATTYAVASTCVMGEPCGGARWRSVHAGRARPGTYIPQEQGVPGSETSPGRQCGGLPTATSANELAMCATSSSAELAAFVIRAAECRRRWARSFRRASLDS